MPGILSKYVGIEIFDDNVRVASLLGLLEAMPESERLLHYAGTPLVGNCFIKDSPGAEQYVLEVVFAADGKDSFATLYKAHPLFKGIEAYREGRAELINCVADLASKDADGLGIKCPLRNRNVKLRDLGTHQIVELIQSAVDTVTIDTSNTKH